jgi:hypothetical protein
MRPSLAFELHRNAVREAVSRFPTTNPRVFGSAIRGTDEDGSIGKAATKVMDIYPEFAEDHSEIPWRSMRGMRNRIAHGYFDINLDVLWDTVQTALPELAAQISGVIR